jgi:probable F420-dependent oxidoreductase
VKLDAGLHGELSKAGERARLIEEFGYDGVIASEIDHDPFFPLLLAAESTERVDLITGIAVAFARNPMLLANIGWDLHAHSGGRFVLGLGSQIKPHIEKRFSMPWSKPAARMQEMIEATKAIWSCWNDGEKLDFRGDFYRHTLMTPMFDPGVNPYGAPPILLAGVGPMMTRVAGRVADGFISHAFQTAPYFREVTLPAIEAGLSESGRTREGFEIVMPTFVVSATSEEDLEARKVETKQRVAFYGSTPAYRPVLEHHGWGDAQTELNTLSKRGEWQAMGDVIDDEMLDQFAIVAEPRQIPGIVRDRFGGIVDRLQFFVGVDDPDTWGPVIEELRAI